MSIHRKIVLSGAGSGELAAAARLAHQPFDLDCNEPASVEAVRQGGHCA